MARIRTFLMKLCCQAVHVKIRTQSPYTSKCSFTHPISQSNTLQLSDFALKCVTGVKTNAPVNSWTLKKSANFSKMHTSFATLKMHQWICTCKLSLHCQRQMKAYRFRKRINEIICVKDGLHWPNLFAKLSAIATHDGHDCTCLGHLGQHDRLDCFIFL